MIYKLYSRDSALNLNCKPDFCLQLAAAPNIYYSLHFSCNSRDLLDSKEEMVFRYIKKIP